VLPPAATAGLSNWTPVTTVNPGDLVRLSVNWNPPGGTATLSDVATIILNNFSPLGTAPLLAYRPGDPKPSDWPVPDPNPNGYAMEFGYGGKTAADLSFFAPFFGGATPAIWVAR
jgi:hypothetical protein